MRNELSVLLDAAVGSLEKQVIRAFRPMNRFPPLFVVGAPRSGTTLIFQYLLNAYRVAYLPNLSKRFPRACVTAAMLTRLRPKAPVPFASRFGILEGAGAPSDGWEVFHRWFPRSDYSIPVDETKLHELRSIVALLEGLYGGPFLNKNISNSLRIGELGRLFPNAIFLHVQRNIPSTTDSILRAREVHSTEVNEWWGTPPPLSLRGEFESELQRVVTQVWGIRHHIHQQFESLPPDQARTVHYEDFCQEPKFLEAWVMKAFSTQGTELHRRDQELPVSFTARENDRVRDPEFLDRVERIIGRLEDGVEPGQKDHE